METEAFHALAAQQAVFAWIFIITGTLTICFALFFLLIIKYSFFKGMAVVFLLTGFLQVMYGILTLNSAAASHLPAEYLEKIHPGSGNFTYLSLAILLLGIILLIVFRRSSQRYWKGLGLGMLIQGALSAGLFAMELRELTNRHATVTQQAMCHTKWAKKIDGGRNS